MSQLTIEIPDALAEELACASRADNAPAEDVVLNILRRALLVRRFNEAQQRIARELGPDAPKSDEEVFEQIS